MLIGRALVWVMVAAASGCVLPQHGSMWERSAIPAAEQGSEPIRVARGMAPRVVLVSMMLIWEQGGSRSGPTYTVERDGSSVRELARTIAARIAANSAVPVVVQSESISGLVAFPTTLQKPIVVASELDAPAFWYAPLPADLRNAPALASLRAQGFTHCLIVIGRTKRVDRPSKVEWLWPTQAIVPVPATESSTSLTFDVMTRMYDIGSTEAVSNLTLTDFASSTFGVQVFVPWAIVVNESSHFLAMAHRIGDEYGRRWVLVEAPGVDKPGPR